MQECKGRLPVLMGANVSPSQRRPLMSSGCRPSRSTPAAEPAKPATPGYVQSTQRPVRAIRLLLSRSSAQPTSGAEGQVACLSPRACTGLQRSAGFAPNILLLVQGPRLPADDVMGYLLLGLLLEQAAECVSTVSRL